MVKTVLDSAAEAQFNHVLVPFTSLVLLILLLLNITSLAVMRRQVHQAQIHELLQDLELRLCELEGVSCISLPGEDCK